jgi:hypothetical protein
MTSGFATSATVIGTIATVVMDSSAVLRARVFGTPLPSYALLGRWIAHLARGRFRHEPIAATPAVSGETLLGWTAHYVTGVAFAAALLAVWGVDWARHASLGPALAVGVGSLAAPFLVMHPGMGLGVAASRAPHPWVARARSIATHLTYGLGLYVGGRLLGLASSAFAY